MRVSVSVGSAYYDGENWSDVVEYVRAAERLGCEDKAAATAAVPDELLLLAHPIGTEEMVRNRIRAYAYADAGVTGVRIGPTGRTAAEQIEHLEQAVDVIRSAVPARP